MIFSLFDYHCIELLIITFHDLENLHSFLGRHEVKQSGRCIAVTLSCADSVVFEI